MSKVLVVDDKPMMRDAVGSTLTRAGFSVIAAGDGAAALKQVAKHRPAAVITDLKMPEMTGLELLENIRKTDADLPVVLMTAYGTVSDAVAAMKHGAHDFVTKPFDPEQLAIVITKAVEHRALKAENAALRAAASAASDAQAPAFIGQSPQLRRVARLISQVAASQSTVLICGESGTGKEVVARAIHAYSQRRDKVMLSVNCAALSASLLESELFGHERGAFTGADQLRKGRFELADGGTLLLDEISEIGPQLQAKLLRVLQEGQFERVGSSATMDIDARVIATTNRNLTRSVAAGDFRQDLYFRLNVLPIELPPLRDRVEDIEPLAEHFLKRVAEREGKEPRTLEADALELLAAYPWPGNVRELQNICERASVLCRGSVIKASLIRPWLIEPDEVFAAAAAGSVTTPTTKLTETIERESAGSMAPAALPPEAFEVRPLEVVEREQIIRTLGEFNGNRQRSAKALGIGVRTLGLKLKKWKEANLVAQTL
ncbi:MAG: sigma-54 dependent transcriptional regulator [Planctomycetota bacterium]